MNENIEKSLNQIAEMILMTESQRSIVKLILEKTYIQGEQEGTNKGLEIARNIIH